MTDTHFSPSFARNSFRVAAVPAPPSALLLIYPIRQKGCVFHTHSRRRLFPAYQSVEARGFSLLHKDRFPRSPGANVEQISRSSAPPGHCSGEAGGENSDYSRSPPFDNNWTTTFGRRFTHFQVVVNYNQPQIDRGYLVPSARLDSLPSNDIFLSRRSNLGDGLGKAVFGECLLLRCKV